MSAYALGGRDLTSRAGLGLLVAAGALLVGTAAVVAPSAAVALVVGLGFVAVALRDFTWGVALFTIITFFDRLPGVGALEANAAKAAGAVVAVAWLIRVTSRIDPVPLLTRSQPLMAYAAVVFVGWAFMSALWAEDGAQSLASSIRLALNVLLLFIVFSAVRSPHDLRLIVGAYIAGAALTAVVGLATGTTTERISSAEVGRLTGQIGDPNEFAAVLVPALVIAAFLFAARRGAVLRWALATCVLLFGIGLFLTQSRGGIVALVVAFAATLLLAGPVRAKALAVILVVGALGISYFTLVAPPEALQRITHFSSGGGSGREDLWTVAYRIWADHPVAGIGIGNFKIVEPRYALDAVDLERVDLVVDTPKVAHNTYLHVLTELGLVGAIALAIVIVAALLAVRRAIRAFARTGNFELEVLARGIAIATIGMLAAFAFISAQYEKQLWLLIGLAAATATVARRADELAPDGAYDLAVREQLVEQLEQRVVERMDALLAEQERLSRRRAQLAAREQELRERMRELETREQTAPGALPAASAPDASRLQERNRQLENRVAELEQRLREVESRPPQRVEVPSGPPPEVVARLEAREQELAQQSRRLDEREREVRERVQALTAREQALARKAAELAQRDRAPAPEPPRPQPVQQPAPEPPRAAVPPPEQVPAEAAAPGAAGGPNLGELEARVARRRDEFPDRADEWDSYLFFLRDHAAADGSLPAQFDYLIADVFGELLAR